MQSLDVFYLSCAQKDKGKKHIKFSFAGELKTELNSSCIRSHCCAIHTILQLHYYMWTSLLDVCYAKLKSYFCKKNAKM